MGSSNAAIIRGGISGGGGNTLKPKPLTENQLLLTIRDSRPMLYGYFNQLDMLGTKVGVKEIDQIKGKIQDPIVNAKIQISGQDCLDREGKKVDASTSSDGSMDICVSKNRLLKKLNSETVQAQVLALLAHEHSHFLGYNEKQANIVQDFVLSAFSRNPGSDSLATLKRTFQSLERVQTISGRPLQDNESWNRLCHIGILLDEANLHTVLVQSGSMSNAFNSTTVGEFNSVRMKIEAFKNGTCGMADFEPNSESYRKFYDDLFGDSKITTDVLVAKKMNFEGPLCPYLLIRKITDSSVAARELQDIRFHTERISRALSRAVAEE